jgi:DNA mismatch repair protein MutL
MRDIIQLLPDAVANQIAAGEVVQRPASLIKELLENSIDAGATAIKLIVRDAGKTFVQIIDNGKGMTETDARLSFERHATSKIRKAEDLFSITTMGFRGEALASIAAVAQVECKTKTAEDELGTELRIEGSKVIRQEYCQTAVGTIISVKNLFYNIPARRNFLKNDNIEFKHIIDEFERVALANPAVEMSLTHNQNPVFQLQSENLRKRIGSIFGKKYNERLVPVHEQTDIVKLSGFVLKPEFARKTRGEQFFFVNNRFIRNNYLNYAIADAFEGLIAPDYHAGYVLFMEIDPARIDVNIHPTKTEIKFDDEKSIYAIIRVSVKHALGQFNIVPTIDFERENAISVEPRRPDQPIRFPHINVNPNFNPFEASAQKAAGKPQNFGGASAYKTSGNQDWQALFVPQPTTEAQLNMHPEEDAAEQPNSASIYQISGGYLAQPTAAGLLLIHQNRAHQRILYERFLQQLDNHSGASQQLLFPTQLNLPAGDMALLQPYFTDLRQIGFDIEMLGQTNLVLQGIPLALQETEGLKALEEIIERIKNNNTDFALNKNHELALVLARNGAIKAGKTLGQLEMLHLAEQLFACQMPHYCPTGKAVLATLGSEQLDKLFT